MLRLRSNKYETTRHDYSLFSSFHFVGTGGLEDGKMRKGHDEESGNGAYGTYDPCFDYLK